MLTNANLTGAMVTGASFESTTSRGFTPQQLYSTQSYLDKNLQGIGLAYNDLTGWDLSRQDLTSADLRFSTLTGTDLTGASVIRTDFSGTTSVGFTKEQLYSTASYQEGNLQGIRLIASDLTGWDFARQNLAGANLERSTLTDANLTKANLTSACLPSSTLTQVNLSGTNLKNANLGDATAVQSAIFASSTIYNQWTVFPSGFDPVAAGLTLIVSPEGDLDADDALDAADVDMLVNKIGRSIQTWWLPDEAFDFNSDSIIDLEDHRAWVKDLAHTWFGDADLN